MFSRIIVALALMSIMPWAEAATKIQGEQIFGEVCEGPLPSHPNVAWRCTERGHGNPEDVVVKLRERWQNGAWRPANADPALLKVQGGTGVRGNRGQSQVFAS